MPLREAGPRNILIASYAPKGIMETSKGHQTNGLGSIERILTCDHDAVTQRSKEEQFIIIIVGNDQVANMQNDENITKQHGFN